MNFLQKLDVIKLSNDKNYTVSEIYDENNITYLMLLENTDDYELTDNIVYAKIVVMPSRKFGIETIESKELKAHLSEVFLPMYKEDYE